MAKKKVKKENIQTTLKQRGAVYGDYRGGVLLRADIMEGLKNEYYNNNGETEMPPEMEGYLWDIVNKLIRLAVTPTHIDTWRDIVGYATLTKESLETNHADQ